MKYSFELPIFVVSDYSSDWIQAAEAFVCVAFSIFHLWLLLSAWKITLRLFDAALLIRAIKEMRFVQRRASIGYLLFFIISSSITLSFISLLLFPWYVTLLLVSVLAFIWGGSLIPPGVLVLSASHQDVAKLVASIAYHARPYRTVHFLMPRSLSPDTDYAEQHALLVPSANLRVIDGTPWEFVVHSVCLWIPIIIIDLRVATQLVDKEVEWIFSNNLQDKTIFITNEAVLFRKVASYSSSLYGSRCNVVDITQVNQAVQSLALKLRRRNS